MKRDDTHLYDDIIVTTDGQYAGTVSVQNLLISLARVESVLAVAGGVCHELNQPLQILLSIEDLFHMGGGLTGRLPEIIEIIHDQIVRIHSITQRLQTITTYTTKSYINETRILDFDQPARLMIQQH